MTERHVAHRAWANLHGPCIVLLRIRQIVNDHLQRAEGAVSENVPAEDLVRRREVGLPLVQGEAVEPWP